MSSTLTENPMVPVDATGPLSLGAPRVGEFVLIPNAGSRYPGRYGYTRTEVTEVAVRTEGTLTSRRIATKAFGRGCWTDRTQWLIATA